MHKKKIKHFYYVLYVVIVISMELITNALLANSTININALKQDIWIKKGTVTTIHFNQEISYMALGDQLIAEVNAINNYTISLHAKIANEVTNINVKTTENNYIFVLHTLDFKAEKAADLHLEISSSSSWFKWFKKENVENKDTRLDHDFNMRARLICNWWLCSDKNIAPVNVWTDGKYTYLDYRDKEVKDIPMVLEVVDEVDTPLNYTIKNGIVVVSALSNSLTIRAGGKWVCIDYVGLKYEVYH